MKKVKIDIVNRINNATTADVPLVGWVCLGSERTLKGQCAQTKLKPQTSCVSTLLPVLIFQTRV